jgi:hypothetical protein
VPWRVGLQQWSVDDLRLWRSDDLHCLELRQRTTNNNFEESRVCKFGASAMNGEQQRQGSVGPTVNGRCSNDCCGLIVWVSSKDCWAGLQRERRQTTETSKKEEEESKKYYFNNIGNS